MVVLASNPKNSMVFFDVTIGRQELGHMKLGSTFHRAMNDFMIQGADFVNGDGTRMASIYRGNFADENFKLKYLAPSLFSMANSGPSTNSYHFFITCSKCDWLNGIHVVFGKIIDGLLIMRKIENVPTGLINKPKLLVERCRLIFSSSREAKQFLIADPASSHIACISGIWHTRQELHDLKGKGHRHFSILSFLWAALYLTADLDEWKAWRPGGEGMVPCEWQVSMHTQLHLCKQTFAHEPKHLLLVQVELSVYAHLSTVCTTVAQGHPASFMPKVGLEVTTSWFVGQPHQSDSTLTRWPADREQLIPFDSSFYIQLSNGISQSGKALAPAQRADQSEDFCKMQQREEGGKERFLMLPASFPLLSTSSAFLPIRGHSVSLFR
ncbi:Peptidyl-prolyl cis-trans isomerase H, partial [Ophiophagus hannah]